MTGAIDIGSTLWDSIKDFSNGLKISFFHTFKTELVHQCRFKTREDAKQAAIEYIEVFYNPERIHSANNYLSPVNYEIQQKNV